MPFRMPRRRRAATTAAPESGGRRRKRMAVARLGGGGGSGGAGERRRLIFGAISRRVRVRWLAALYRRALRRLRASYANAVRDLVEGKALLGALRAPVDVECSRAAAFGPVATVGF